MIRTILAAAPLFALAIQAGPAGAQAPRGESEPPPPPESAAPLFPQPSLALPEALRPDRPVAPVPSLAFAALQEQEAEEDPDRELKKYIGVGLMVVGGINTLYGLNCVASQHSWGNACWPYLGVSVGIGIGGWVLYKRNR